MFFKSKRKQEKTNTNIYSCCEGELVPLSRVNDEMFSKGILGDGFAIRPHSGTIVSPIDGVITMISNTKHAFGIRNMNGLEILIHVGIDTVLMEKPYFDYLVGENSHVVAGQEILKFSPQQIIDEGFDPIVINVFTNGELNHTFAYLNHTSTLELHQLVCTISY